MLMRSPLPSHGAGSSCRRMLKTCASPTRAGGWWSEATRDPFLPAGSPRARPAALFLGRHRLHQNGTGAPGQRASTAGGEAYAARQATAARDAVWLAARTVARALGAAGSGRGGDLSDVDRGWP